jgi:hypothetical protein
MLKIIPPRGNKGFVYSPFVAAALVVLSIGVCLHFASSEARRLERFTAVGGIEAAVLEMEEAKQAVDSKALLCYIRAASSGVNLTNEEIAAAASAELTEYALSMRPKTFSSVDGNFSLLLEDSGGGLVLKSEEAPLACTNASAAVCSKLGVERRVDLRWML